MEEIFIILALIFLNGIFAMSEIALISARKSSLSNDASNGNKSAKTALKLAEEPDKFLSTIQIGITLIGILTGIFSGDLLSADFAKILINWGIPTSYSYSIAQVSIIIIVTYLSLIFGELVPKRLGMSMAEKIAKVVSRPMNLLSIIGKPFVCLLTNSTKGIVSLLRIKDQETKVTEEEIKQIIKEGKEDGEVQGVEQDIMERVFLMGDMRVDSIMTHRKDVIWIDEQTTKEEIRELLSANLFQVYPIGKGSLDSLQGVALLKDIALHLNDKNFNIKEITRQAVYLYEDISVYNALAQIKELKTNYALVCNEYGGFQGIITYKDILEGLVGNLDNPKEEPDIIKRSTEDGWLVDGQCPFHDFLTYFELEHLYTFNKYNTISGLILSLLEHIPISGEQVTWKNFSLEIIDMDGVRIDKVLVKKLKEN